MAAPGTLFIREANATISLLETRTADLTELKRASKHSAYFDMDHLQFPLVVRNFRPGDRFSPLGLEGTQKVKTYFINNKVPRSERQRCPIILSKGKIIWVAGHRIDNHVKIRARTHKILKAELILA
jgi:tRNA(Ile)-lysidine synthase